MLSLALLMLIAVVPGAYAHTPGTHRSRKWLGAYPARQHLATRPAPVLALLHAAGYHVDHSLVLWTQELAQDLLGVLEQAPGLTHPWQGRAGCVPQPRPPALSTPLSPS